MSCYSFILRNVLFISNLFFVVTGLALLVVGAITKQSIDALQPIQFNGAIDTAPNFLIVVGIIVSFVTSLGCYGAVKKHKRMLISYVGILICILVAQIGAGLYVLIKAQYSNQNFTEDLIKTFDSYGTNVVTTEYVDTVQQEFECCGVLRWQEYPDGRYPHSCCQDNVKWCDNPFAKGCNNVIHEHMRDLSKRIGKVALGLVFAEVMTIILTLRLVNSINMDIRSYDFCLVNKK